MVDEHATVSGAAVELGIVTPVLTLLPGAHARWELDGTLDDVVRIARGVDDLGYHHLTCSEHIAVPAEVAVTRWRSRPGIRWPPSDIWPP